MEDDAFLQIKPYVSWTGIDFLDIKALEKLLDTQFEDVDPVSTVKHKLYKLYLANKDLDIFLNNFLVLAKKTKLDDSYTLDFLYKKPSNEFKNFLVTKKKQINLNNLIKKLCSMDASIKIINQQKQSTLSTVNTFKPAIQQTTRFVQAQPTRFAAAAPTIVTTSFALSTLLFSTVSGTHAEPTDVSSAGKQGPLTTEKNEQKNKLDLCRYCGQPGHIAIDHKNSNTLLAKHCAAGIHKMTMVLSENTLSSSIVTLKDYLLD